MPEPTPGPRPAATPSANDELRALRAEVRTLTEVLDKTFNERHSPFWKTYESRTRMAVGCGSIIGLVLLAVLSLVLWLATGGLLQ